MSLARKISIAFAIALLGQAASAAYNSQDIRVLSYNINALPSVAKKGGSDQYEAIAQELRERRKEGTHPQVVLLQEVFNSKADVIIEQTGYPFVVHGPGRKDTSKRGKAHWSQQTRKQYSTFTNPQKFTGSGLVILSDFPILEAHHKAFDSDTCAGIDCLANKAIMMVRLDVPGLDVPLDVINSHFNSRGTAAAPKKWTLKAHQKQTDTLVWFLDKMKAGNPQILAGDFNTKYQARYNYFKEQVGFVDIGENCLALEAVCTVDPATKTDMILYNTNDKHFAAPGQAYGITPTFVARNFTGKVNGKPFSDHLGYEVHYRLTPSANLSR
ncbi:MAG: endonuclease/exonuclease/phosphatase family protein [Alphaproteobacteria bacterium]|nr:endonuclease/exonuclease/phosphatase family protein [Alphaproteobacteria bacterium]